VLLDDHQNDRSILLPSVPFAAGYTNCRDRVTARRADVAYWPPELFA
jgi:hypothetical protein